jgi:sarcosine oxidase subunit beta
MTVTTADTVVIGAGILGAATAFRLAQRGQRVALVERGSANREGSGATAGNVHVQALHTRRPGQEVPVDTARFLPLQRATHARWATVEDELGADVELQSGGGFMVAETDDQCKELEIKAGWEATAGIPTEVLDGDTARRELPLLGPTVRAATWCPWDGYANPLLVTPAYLAAGRRCGVALYERSAVRSIDRGGDTWRVAAGAHTFEAPVVVDVAGPWLGDVAALVGAPLRMAPVAIQMHAMTGEAPVLRHLIQHIGEGLSVKQVRAGHVLIGGGWPATRFDPARRSRPLATSIAGNLAQATRILPFLGQRRLLRAWAGPLAATPDEMPVVGAVPGAPGFFLAGGTYAFTFAPLWAEVLTALVLAEAPPVDIDDLGPARLMAAPAPAYPSRRS